MPELNRQKKQMIKVFHHEARRLLTESERRMLFRVLKNYQRRRQVEQLVDGLSIILHSPEKLDLLQHIRDLIPRSHVAEFDRHFRRTVDRRGRVQDHDVYVHHSEIYGRVSRNLPSDPGVDGRLARYRPTSSLDIASTSKHHRPRSIASNHESLFDAAQGGDIKVITISKPGQDGGLGFSVRGGSEHGLGMYVSEVEQGSVADSAGLEVGDKILEVNNISLSNVASSSAVSVLTGSAKLKLMIERTGQVPEWRLSREKVSWFDSHTKRLIAGDFEDIGANLFIRGLDVDIPERRVTLSCTKHNQTLGFNIRGGNEYGLGIYVSNVDKGSLAAKNGVRVGDQIIDVNGVPFDNISHPHAVEVLKSQSHLILTLRDVGRYPAFKELFAEYTWSDKSIKGGSIAQRYSKLKQTKLHDLWLDKESTQRNPSLLLRVPIQSKIYSGAEQSDELPLQAEIYLPHQQKGHYSGSRTGTGDNVSTISLENWSSRVEGTMNPAYLQNESDEATDTDDESGVHGEYDITMDDIIGSNAKKTHEVQVEIEDTVANPSLDNDDEKNDVYSVIPLYDRATRKKDDSDPHNELGDVPGDDEAVVVLSPMMDVSSDSDSQDTEIEQIVENVREISTGHENEIELSPLAHSAEQMDIDSLSSASVNSVIYRKGNVSRADVYRVPNATSVHSDSLSSRHNSPLYSAPLKVPVSPAKSSGTLHEMEGEKSTSGGNPYEINFEEDDDLMFVMQNFDRQIQDLEQRQSNIGYMEMTSLSPQHSPSTEHTGPDSKTESSLQKKKLKKSSDDSEKQAKWKFIYEKLKGSLRMKSARMIFATSCPPEPISVFTDGEVDEDSGGSVSSGRASVFSKGIMGGKGVLHQHTFDRHNMTVLKDAANKLLSTDEHAAVIKHVETYHKSHDLDKLVESVLILLDKPEKILLLRDIRGVLYPVDYTRFDQKVNRYEVDAYEKLSTKLHLQLKHADKGQKPKRHLLMTEVESNSEVEGGEDKESNSEVEGGEDKDESGHFYIKPVEQHQKEQEIKQHVLDLLSGKDIHHDLSDYEDDQSEVSVTESDEPEIETHAPQPKAIIVAFIDKSKPTLGLCISGGSNSRKQPEVKVDKVITGGAAADEPNIKPGMVILSVDDVDMTSVTHKEAVTAVKDAFRNKDSAMKLVLRRDS